MNNDWMSEREKTNLQNLRDLTDTLCVGQADAQCGKCQMLFSELGVVGELNKVKTELKEVLEALKLAREECVALRAEVAGLKKQLKTTKGD